ncbi:extracellular solute-binding protein [Desulfovibrio sp. OttesenSCG-928-F07]|nr:extracellular solute-binding protein [Desulfovibrio sp. OttesenSCG-928-F07]
MRKNSFLHAKSCFLRAVLMLCLTFACTLPAAFAEQTGQVAPSAPASAPLIHHSALHIYTWPGLLPEWLRQEFYAETGILVNYSFFATPFSMLYNATSNNFNFDLLLGPLELCPELVREKRVALVDYKRLTQKPLFNTALYNNTTDPKFSYMLPLYFGVSGLIVNTELAPANSINSLAQLLSPELKGMTLLPNSVRPNITLALLIKGLPVINPTQPDINAATGVFTRMAENAGFFSTVGVHSIIYDNKIAVGFGRNKKNTSVPEGKLEFKIPAEGGTLWVDGLFISSTTRKSEEVYKFLNFIMQQDIAARLSDETGMATAIRGVQAKMLRQDIARDPLIYLPAEKLNKMPFNVTTPEAMVGTMHMNWLRVMGSR